MLNKISKLICFLVILIKINTQNKYYDKLIPDLTLVHNVS
jgi:hypothetical protein